MQTCIPAPHTFKHTCAHMHKTHTHTHERNKYTCAHTQANQHACTQARTHAWMHWMHCMHCTQAYALHALRALHVLQSLRGLHALRAVYALHACHTCHVLNALQELLTLITHSTCNADITHLTCIIYAIYIRSETLQHMHYTGYMHDIPFMQTCTDSYMVSTHTCIGTWIRRHIDA